MVMPFFWVYIKLHLRSCQQPFLQLPQTPTTPPTFLKWLMHGNSSYIMLLLYSNYQYGQGTTTFLSKNISYIHHFLQKQSFQEYCGSGPRIMSK